MHLICHWTLNSHPSIHSSFYIFQTILFTTDENILECVSRNDDAYEGEMFDSDEPDDVPFERPRTADAGDEVSLSFCSTEF